MAEVTLPDPRGRHGLSGLLRCLSVGRKPPCYEEAQAPTKEDPGGGGRVPVDSPHRATTASTPAGPGAGQASDDSGFRLSPDRRGQRQGTPSRCRLPCLGSCLLAGALPGDRRASPRIWNSHTSLPSQPGGSPAFFLLLHDSLSVPAHLPLASSSSPGSAWLGLGSTAAQGRGMPVTCPGAGHPPGLPR